MPNDRRACVPGGTFFFTVVTHQRHPIFESHVARLRLGECFREAIRRWPMNINAMVLLPDHLHAIWSLPNGDSDYSRRWSWMKKEFTKRWLQKAGTESSVSTGRQKEGRRGIWQPRFWEHTIRDEDDFERHFDDIHYNPVKHGLVRCPHQWPYSSFHRWVKRDVYPRHWACAKLDQKALNFEDIEQSVGE